MSQIDGHRCHTQCGKKVALLVNGRQQPVAYALGHNNKHFSSISDRESSDHIYGIETFQSLRQRVTTPILSLFIWPRQKNGERMIRSLSYT